jgi:beta-glucosidase
LGPRKSCGRDHVTFFITKNNHIGLVLDKFIPDEDGDWEFSLAIAGLGNFFFDGKLAIDLSTNPEQGESFFGLGTVDVRTVIKGLKAKQTYHMEIRLGNATFIAGGSPFTCRGGIQFGAIRQIGEEDAIRDAVALAKESDGM